MIELSSLSSTYIIQKNLDLCREIIVIFLIYDRFASKRALIILKNIASNIYFSSGPLMHSKNTFYIGNMLYLLLKFLLFE